MGVKKTKNGYTQYWSLFIAIIQDIIKTFYVLS